MKFAAIAALLGLASAQQTLKEDQVEQWLTKVQRDTTSLRRGSRGSGGSGTRMRTSTSTSTSSGPTTYTTADDVEFWSFRGKTFDDEMVRELEEKDCIYTQGFSDSMMYRDDVLEGRDVCTDNWLWNMFQKEDARYYMLGI